MEKVNDCASCRHHSKQPREKLTGWQEEDHFELEDKDRDSFTLNPNAVVYRCGAPEGPYAGTEVGAEPVTCASFSAGTHVPVPSTLQSAYDAFLARQAARGRE